MRKTRKFSLLVLMVLILLFTFSTAMASDETSTTTDLSYCKVVSYDKVEDYTEIDGYLFAGWFTNESCEPSTALTGSDVPETVYAKYVPKEILGLRVQVTSKLWDDDTTNDSTGALRFVTSVDTLDYSEVGFIINIGTKDNYKASKYVYKELYSEIGSENKTKVDTFVPSDMFHSKSVYFKTYTVQNISEFKYLREFKVTPYWKTLDGTEVHGDMRTVTVNQLRQWDYVFVDDSGEASVTNDDNTTSVNPGVGTRNYPFKTLEAALDAMKTNQAYQSNGVDVVSEGEADVTVYILNSLTANSEFAWDAHGLDVVVRGDKAEKASSFNFNRSEINTLNIGDSVTFENMTLLFPENVFAWGNRLKVTDTVDVENTVTDTVSIYGGGSGDDGDDTDDDSVKNTSVTLLTGTYKAVVGGGYQADVTGNTKLHIAGNTKVYNGTTEGNESTYVIYGGGYEGNVGGNTEVYVAGDVNADMEYDNADHKSFSAVHGGSYNATVTGDTCITVEGNALFVYIYGGGRGNSSVVNGTSTVNFRGSAKSMSIFGGSLYGKNNNDTFVEMSGDTTVFQVFGGSESKSMNGNTNVRILDGTVKRRVYGGCYNNYKSSAWQTSHSVSGNTNVTIGKDADLVFDYTKLGMKSDNSLYATSRHANPFEGEVGNFIFTDYIDDSELESKIGYVDGLGSFGYEDDFSSTTHHYLVKAYTGGNVYSDGDVLHIEPNENMAATVTIYTDGTSVETHYATSDSTYMLPKITSTTEQHEVKIEFGEISDNKDISGYAVKMEDATKEGVAYYTSLEAAVNSVATTDAKTITLLADAEISSALTIDKGENVTIIDDGNVRTINSKIAGNDAWNMMITVKEDATLTLKSTGTANDYRLILDGTDVVDAGAMLYLEGNTNTVLNIYNGVRFQNINNTTAAGGVIRVGDNSGFVNVDGAHFENVTAKEGSAFYFRPGNVTCMIKNTVFENCSSITNPGGAIVVKSGVTCTITDTQFVNCSANKGGAISNGGTLKLTDCTFSDNSATSEYIEGVPYSNDIYMTDATAQVHISGKMVAEIFNEAASVINVDGTLKEGSDVKLEWRADDASKVPSVGIEFASAEVMDASKDYISLGEMVSSSYLLTYADAKGKLIKTYIVTNFNEETGSLTGALTEISNSTNKAGVIRLGADIDVTSTITIPENCNIIIEDDGSGTVRTINRTKDSWYMISVGAGETLTLRSTGTADDCRLVLDGAQFTGYGAMIEVTGGTTAVLNINNGVKFQNNNSSQDGSTIRVQDSGGVVSVDGAYFYNLDVQHASKSRNGGAITLYGGNATCTIKNATFENCYSNGSGGAIDVKANTMCTITDTQFVNCSANKGGAISNGGTLKLTDCTFTNNSATSEYIEGVPYGNDIYMTDATAQVHISGKMVAEIFNEAASVINVDGTLKEGSDVKLEWRADDASKVPSVGIIFANDAVMNASQSYISLGEMTFAKYSLVYANTKGTLAEAKKVTTFDEFSTALTEISASTDKLGVIRLGADINVSSQVTIPENCNVTIEDDGSGEVRTLYGTTNAWHMISVDAGETLTLRGTGAANDCRLVLDGAQRTGTFGAMIQVTGGTTAVLNVYNGVKFQNNSSADHGSAIRVESTGGTVSVDGASFSNINIINATAAKNGGVFTLRGGNATCTIKNATFENCYSNGYGGAVEVKANTTCTITDSSFENIYCSDSCFGGAIYIWTNGSCTISNTTFAECHGKDGGAIYNAGSLKLVGTSEKALFQGNYASRYGGAIGTDGATFEVDGYTFDGNYAQAGGAIIMKTASTLKNTTFKNNHTNVTGGFGGGAIWVTKDSTFTDCVFENNKAASEGGAINVRENITCNLISTEGSDKAMFKDNIAGTEGSAIYLYKSTLTGSGYTFTPEFSESVYNNNGTIDYKY